MTEWERKKVNRKERETVRGRVKIRGRESERERDSKKSVL